MFDLYKRIGRLVSGRKERKVSEDVGGGFPLMMGLKFVDSNQSGLFELRVPSKG